MGGTWAIFHCSPRCLGRELGGKLGSQDSYGDADIASRGLTCCVFLSKCYKYPIGLDVGDIDWMNPLVTSACKGEAKRVPQRRVQSGADHRLHGWSSLSRGLISSRPWMGKRVGGTEGHQCL